MDVHCEQRGCLKENGKVNEIFDSDQKETVENHGNSNEENMILIRHMKGESNREQQ